MMCYVKRCRSLASDRTDVVDNNFTAPLVFGIRDATLSVEERGGG